MKTNVVKNDETKRTEWSYFLALNRNKIKEMSKLVEEIHKNVNQNYDEMPYSYHTNMVANLFMLYGSACFKNREDMEGFGIVAVFAALFHDTIEDARLTYNDVLEYAKEFMPPTLVGIDGAVLAADIVYALTNEKGKNRAERENDKYFEGVKNTPYAPCIKMCDRYANALYANARDTSMAKKYSKEMRQFLERLMITGDDEIETSLSMPYELYMVLQTFPIMEFDETRVVKVNELTNLTY